MDIRVEDDKPESARNVHHGRQDFSSNDRYWKSLVNGLGTLDWR